MIFTDILTAGCNFLMSIVLGHCKNFEPKFVVWSSTYESYMCMVHFILYLSCSWSAFTGPPRIIRHPVNQQVVNEVDISFECLALAEPLHSLTWYFIGVNGINTTIGSVNGTEKMIGNNETYRITDSMTLSTYGRLVIRDVQFEDRGTYMCLAENRHGSETASATLAVQGE